MTSIFKPYRVALLSAAVFLAASLTGCVAQAPTAGPKSTHSSTAVATPKPTIAALTPGAVVTANSALPEGQVAYKLADGSLVVVDRSQPLPAVVQSGLVAEVQTLQAKLNSSRSSDSTGSIGQELGNLRMQEGNATGKQIVTVFHANNNPPQPGGYWSFWPMPASIDLSSQPNWTRADVMGYADNFVASQENPETFAIIVAP